MQLRRQSTTPDWRKGPDSPRQHGWHSGAAVGVQKPRKCVYFEPLNWFTISHLFVQSPDGFDTWPWTVSDPLWPPGLQHTRLTCPSLSPGVCSNCYPLNQWCYLIISFLLPTSPALNLSQHQGLFQWGGSLRQVAKVSEFQLQHQSLPINSQAWFPLGLTGLISLLSKGLSRVFSSTTVRKHQFFRTYGQHPYMTTRKIIALTIQTFEPTSLTSALADRFSTARTTWEALWTALRTDESSFSFEKQINPKYLLMSCLYHPISDFPLFWFTHL